MNMTRAAAARTHAVFPLSITSGMTNSHPLWKIAWGNGNTGVTALCYGGVTAGLNGCYGASHPASPGAIEQGARNKEVAAEGPLLCLAGGRSFALCPMVLLS